LTCLDEGMITTSLSIGARPRSHVVAEIQLPSWMAVISAACKDVRNERPEMTMSKGALIGSITG